MAISTLKDLFAEQLKDLYNSEEQIQEAYARWKDSTETSDLREMFAQHVEESNKRKRHIEQACDEIGISPSGEKCEGTEGLIKEGDELLEEVEAGAITDASLIAACQRIEHYGIAGYGCARAYANQLGYDEATENMQRAVDKAIELDQKMTDLAERVLNPEAAQV